jgi:hypothetical protein
MNQNGDEDFLILFLIEIIPILVIVLQKVWDLNTRRHVNNSQVGIIIKMDILAGSNWYQKIVKRRLRLIKLPNLETNI